MPTKAEIQHVRSLRDKKVREAEGRFVVEGPKPMRELLAGGMDFEAVYATEEWSGRCTQRVTAMEMERMSHYPTPSCVLAVGLMRRRGMPAAGEARGLVLALDGVQDPGNVGTLIRVADWYAIDRVLLSSDCADLFSQKAINASMGSFARVAVHTGDLPAWLGDCGVPVMGCDLQGEDVHGAKPPETAVIVIGSEGRGPSPAVRARVTRWVTIPRLGGAESLNAALAGAIVCDNLRRNAAVRG